MRCKSVAMLATQFIDDGLSGAQAVALRAHVVECPACRLYIGQLRHTVRAVHSLGSMPALPMQRASALVAFRALRGSVAAGAQKSARSL